VCEVPAVRASVDCGCVEFCLVWTKKYVDATVVASTYFFVHDINIVT
jgi:hypothetical protein